MTEVIGTCFLRIELQMAAIFQKFVNRAAVAVGLSVLFCEFPSEYKISASSVNFGSSMAVQIAPSPEDKQIHADKQKQFSSLKY